MPYFIEITQYGVARIHRQQKEIKGLFTKDLEVCLAVAAVSNDKMVLMHFDTNLDTDDVAKQIGWVGSPYTLHIGMHPEKLNSALSNNAFLSSTEDLYSLNKFFERLKISLNKLSLPVWKLQKTHHAFSGMFAVLTDGTINTRRPSDEIKSPENAEARKCLDFLHYLTSSQPNTNYACLSLDVQYDNDHWTAMPMPSPVVAKLLDYYKQAKNWDGFIAHIKTDNSLDAGLTMIFSMTRSVVQPAIENYIAYEKNAPRLAVTSSTMTKAQTDEEIASHAAQAQEGTSGSSQSQILVPVRGNDIEEKEAQLNQKTNAFFKNESPASWKTYPANQLTGKYVGHQVRFFTMRANKIQNAKDFSADLNDMGFKAELKTAQRGRPSIVVDLTTSSPVVKPVVKEESNKISAAESPRPLAKLNASTVDKGRGEADKHYHLGGKYKHGIGCSRDFQKAVQHYRIAADLGDRRAQHNLAVCYDEGHGVKPDKVEAAKWYGLAAEQGYGESQHNLALCYENGDGVEQNDKKSAEWYLKAAKQGLAISQFNIAVCYYHGKGADKNMEEAEKWCKLAAAQGHQKAKMAMSQLFNTAPARSISSRRK